MIRVVARYGEELNSLVMTLKNASVDDEYVTTIVETLRFLVHARRSSIARELFEVYCEMRSGVNDVQERRKALASREREGSRRKARREGQNFHEVDVGCEGEVDALSCPELPYVVREMFSYIYSRPRPAPAPPRRTPPLSFTASAFLLS